jgi:hypothetical protein
MLLRSKPLRDSEQNPDRQKQSHMASQSQWLPGNSLKTARVLAQVLELCQRVNSGVGLVVTLLFQSTQLYLGREDIWGSIKQQYITFSPANKHWIVEVKYMS